MQTQTAVRAHKRIKRRRERDHSQSIRHAVQWAFLALNVWIGVEFYLWVRYYETGGAGVHVTRPAGVEGWLPIASLMNLKYWIVTGGVPRVHPAGMFLLLAFVGIAFLLRKSFCSWLCPVGTVSEWLWRAGRSMCGRSFRLPKWFDVALRSLKYILLALFLYAVGSMTTEAIRAFLDGPYGMISDVKMLNFFRHMGIATAVTVGALAIGSVFYQNFWCRYLCPYGALLGLAARFSPVRIRRSPSLCIDCAKCTKACPSLLPVDVLLTIRSPECTGCYECVTSCPAAGALEMTVGRRCVLPAWAMAAGIVFIFLAIAGYARWTGHWHTDLPKDVLFDLVPHAAEFQHP
ncbi:MAG: 4Fe-4S binding protein [Acidobacteriales bacterium]|nr:4Fe-4S binding protein [Terriglobales bacterium]